MKRTFGQLNDCRANKQPTAIRSERLRTYGKRPRLRSIYDCDIPTYTHIAYSYRWWLYFIIESFCALCIHSAQHTTHHTCIWFGDVICAYCSPMVTIHLFLFLSIWIHVWLCVHTNAYNDLNKIKNKRKTVLQNVYDILKTLIEMKLMNIKGNREKKLIEIYKWIERTAGKTCYYFPFIRWVSTRTVRLAAQMRLHWPSNCVLYARASMSVVQRNFFTLLFPLSLSLSFSCCFFSVFFYSAHFSNCRLLRNS